MSRGREPTNPGGLAVLPHEDTPEPEQPRRRSSDQDDPKPFTLDLRRINLRHVLILLGGLGAFGPGASMAYGLVNWPWVSKAEFEKFEAKLDDKLTKLGEKIDGQGPDAIAAAIDTLATKKAAAAKGKRR